jgi:hypothetical protein
MKINFKLLILFACFSYFLFIKEANSQGTSQDLQTVKDTAYVVQCYYLVPNGRPVQSSFILKNLNVFHRINFASTTTEDFFCSFFKQSIIFDEPFFTLGKNSNLIQFANEKQKQDYLNREALKIKFLNKSFSKSIHLTFRNGKLNFQFAKIYGEFWILKTDLSQFKSSLGFFDISDSCYQKHYKYNQKYIYKVLNMDTELEQLQTQ